MTKEERELRREQREHMKRMEAAAKEAGRGPIDVPFLLLVLLLTGVGLIILLSASFPSAYYESGDPLYYFKRQAAFATLGLAAMVVIGRINYARFRGVAKIALGISIALLVAVIIPGVGITSHGATRWLGIPGTTMQFQPSEIAKLGVILYFADSISKKKDKMRTLRYGILPYGFILALIAVLMYFEHRAHSRHRRGDDVRRRYPRLLGRHRHRRYRGGGVCVPLGPDHLQLLTHRHLARPAQRCF